MKIRKGFVSNSSSTSFLIVGVYGNNDQRLADLAVADSWEEGGCGYNTGKTLVFLGSDYNYDDDDNPCDYEPSCAGIEAEDALKNGAMVDNLKEEFIKKAHALGVDFTADEVDLHYGEISSE